MYSLCTIHVCTVCKYTKYGIAAIWWINWKLIKIPYANSPFKLKEWDYWHWVPCSWCPEAWPREPSTFCCLRSGHQLDWDLAGNVAVRSLLREEEGLGWAGDRNELCGPAPSVPLAFARPSQEQKWVCCLHLHRAEWFNYNQQSGLTITGRVVYL